MIIINGTKRGITSMLSLINRVTLHPEPKYHLPEWSALRVITTCCLVYGWVTVKNASNVGRSNTQSVLFSTVKYPPSSPKQLALSVQQRVKRFACFYGEFVRLSTRIAYILLSPLSHRMFTARFTFFPSRTPIQSFAVHTNCTEDTRLVAHNISSKAENSFITAILPRHCVITTSP